MPLDRELRVVILVPSLHGGGAEFVASRWGEYLRSQGDTVTFLTTHAEETTASVHLQGRWFGERAFSLRRILKSDQFDVVLALAPHWNLLATLASVGLRNRPAIAISGRTIETEARRAGNNKAVELLLARYLYHYADGFIAISHATAAEAQAKFRISLKRLWVIPNPALGKVEFNRVLGSKPLTRGLAATSTQLNIVVPGRLTPSKRPALAMAVAMRCAEISGRDVRLHFFGSGKLEEETKSIVPKGFKVQFHGWVEQWFDNVPPGAVILLPSRIEGFANVLVEAAAMGFPAVASSRALGVSDAIIPGLTGLLAVSDSPEDYALAVLAAEPIRPGENVRPWLTRFTVESSGTILRETLKHIISTRR